MRTFHLIPFANLLKVRIFPVMLGLILGLSLRLRTKFCSLGLESLLTSLNISVHLWIKFNTNTTIMYRIVHGHVH